MESEILVDRKTKRKSKLKSKKKIIIKIIIGIICIIILILSYFGFKSYKFVASYDDKVYPGVYLLNEDISGFSESELQNKLQSIANDISTKTININIKDKPLNETYANLGVVFNNEDLKNQIFSYGKDNSFFEKLELLKEYDKKNFDIKVSYNKDKVNELVNKIYDDNKIEPINATISIDSAKVIVGKETVGSSINKEKMVKDIDTKINDINNNDSNIEVEFNEIQPEITSKILNEVDGKIASFTTHYKEGPSGHNLQIATKNIDDSLLMPGKEFSTELAIGPTTIENGFVAANTYVAGEVVPGVGGGVCQLSSTLYNSILRAGIIPTQRMNHMMTVPYVPLGLDATLADGLIDLKFKNDFEIPIVVNTYYENYAVTVELWSKKDILKGMTYEPESYVNGLYAETWLYGYDASGNKVLEKYIDNSKYEPF